MSDMPLDCRHYHALMARQAAELRLNRLRTDAAVYAADFDIESAAATNAAADEWRGIALACNREINRLARIKHRTAT